MAKRRFLSKAKSKRIFRKSSGTSRRNLSRGTPMRGGIRL